MAGLLCTGLTLPYLWFILPSYVDTAYYVPVGETLVVIAEAGVLHFVAGLVWKRAAACSLIMNMASFGLGRILI